MDRGLLNRATTADAQPTPGYMYLEIAKMTYAPNGSHQLEDYLCNKIASKDDANVKFKCLRIIRNILDPDAQVQASMDFKKRMQRRADVVKSCRMFRGPVDPLRGDAPNKAVRVEAEAALKMIFNEATIGQQHQQQPTAAAAPYSGLHDRIKGFGSTSGGPAGPPPAWGGAPSQQQQQPLPYPGGVYPGPPVSTGRMQGFGNPEFNDFNNSQQASAGSTIAGKVGQAAASAASVLSSAYQRWHGGGSGTNAGTPPQYSGYGPTPGYGNGYPGPQEYNHYGQSDRGMWVPPSVDKSGERTQMTVAAPSGEQQHRTAEYRLVSQLASGSVTVGVFLTRVTGESSDYDMTEIASELAGRITKGHPQARLRALRAVEGLADKEEVRDICTECVSDPHALPQICRATAARVSRALQGTTGPRPTAAAAPAQPSMPDLLDLGGGDTSADEQTKKPEAAKNGGDDLLLLGDGDLIDAPVKSSAPEVDLSGLNLGQSVPAGSSSNSQLLPDFQPASDNLLGAQSPSGVLPTQQASTLLPDLAVGSIQANGRQQQSYAAGRSGSDGLDTPGGQQLDDIFAKAAAKAAAQATGGPPNVTNSGMRSQQQQAAAGGPPSSSSAFSFIGSGSGRR
ncbi:AP-4 complex accessory subunit Tepsin [Perkinsus olseni]|uniref:AP-4 complex accessory subunit Tepsin n=1 Tax=Perkinsus olseni TaxID=32597 RepID=A0A7J6Q0Z6_PEROL|nr:AP-4 complex accessory subunit Tepsin [Perkinsus olseni]